MKTGNHYAIVLVTAPDMKTGRKIACAVLRDRLAACVTMVPRLESLYWWQGKLEKSAETLLLIKTTSRRLKALERTVLQLHPYDTPEFVVLRINGGNARYLKWLRTESETPITDGAPTSGRLTPFENL